MRAILSLTPLQSQYVFLALLWALIALLVLIFIGSLILGRRPQRPAPAARPNAAAVGPFELLVEAPSVNGAAARSERIQVHSHRITIGRSPSSDLKIDDEFASSNHAVLFRQENALYIEDLDSTNGTFLNEKPIGGTVKLKSGDSVRIGKTVLQVQ